MVIIAVRLTFILFFFFFNQFPFVSTQQELQESKCLMAVRVTQETLCKPKKIICLMTCMSVAPSQILEYLSSTEMFVRCRAVCEKGKVIAEVKTWEELDCSAGFCVR